MLNTSGVKEERMPAYATQQMMLKEQLTVPGDATDYPLGSLKEGECAAMLFKGSGVAILLCNLGGGIWRIAGKPIPPPLKRELE